MYSFGRFLCKNRLDIERGIFRDLGLGYLSGYFENFDIYFVFRFF